MNLLDWTYTITCLSVSMSWLAITLYKVFGLNQKFSLQVNWCCSLKYGAFDRIQMSTMNWVECDFSVQSIAQEEGLACQQEEKVKFKRVQCIVTNCARHCAIRLEVRIDKSVAKGRQRAMKFSVQPLFTHIGWSCSAIQGGFDPVGIQAWDLETEEIW